MEITRSEAVKLADDSRRVVLNHLRQWAEERFKVACDLMKSSTIKRQQWQQRGHAEILRDLLHHLDSLEEEAELAAEDDLNRCEHQRDADSRCALSVGHGGESHEYEDEEP